MHTTSRVEAGSTEKQTQALRKAATLESSWCGMNHTGGTGNRIGKRGPNRLGAHPRTGDRVAHAVDRVLPNRDTRLSPHVDMLRTGMDNDPTCGRDAERTSGGSVWEGADQRRDTRAARPTEPIIDPPILGRARSLRSSTARSLRIAHTRPLTPGHPPTPRANSRDRSPSTRDGVPLAYAGGCVMRRFVCMQTRAHRPT